MSLISKFKTNKNTERDGKWFIVDVGKGDKNPMFLMARMTRRNKHFKKTFDKYMKPYKKLHSNGLLSDEVADSVSVRAFVDSILLDWRFVEPEADLGFNPECDEEGYAIYSRDNALELFKIVPDFFDVLEDLAADAGCFKDVVEENELKN